MKVRCPDCGSKGVLKAELAGEMARCSQCGSKFVAREEPSENEGVKWYYGDGDQKKGPFGAEEFARMIDAGIVAPETLVWSKGMRGWQTLAETQGEPGVSVAPLETVLQPVAPESRAQEQATAAKGAESRASWLPGVPYAGVTRRLVAKVIDLAFMAVIAILVDGLSRKLFPAEPGSAEVLGKVYIVTMLIDMLLGMIYITWFVGKFGATPGKMVFNLKVVNPSGGKVGYGQAFGRYWAEFVVIWLTIMLGYLPILFDPQRRGLHDRLCNTRVVQV